MQKQDLEKNYLRLRRDLFDRYYAAMNEKQREAIYQVTGPLLVLAGAGTGKTTVLVNRIAQILRYGRAAESGTIPQDLSPTLLSGMESAKDLSHEELAAVLDEFAEDPCEGYRVLAITFTNKAANEIKERLEALVGERASEVWSGTFHSVCMRILRRYGDRIGYAPGFTIYDTDDQKKVVSESLKQQNIDEKQLPVKTVLNAISRAKDNLLTPDDYESEVGADFRLSQISAVYALYQKKLEDANAVDFDDIIMKTVLLLQKDPEVLAHYQNQFRYVLVDEYQDTNHAQFLLTSLLAGKHKNLMVVGDDDQSIYKFRGATIENILHFDQSFTDAKIIKLEQNYRSTGNILGAANSVIRNNFGRRGKELWCERGDGEKIISCRLDNQISEAAYVVDRIMDLKNREKRKFSDFAVLYRVNAQSLNLEQIFAKSGIPYRLLGGLRFYDRKEVKDILAYLSVINNPSDNLRLRRIINEPKRKIGEATVTALESIAIYESVSMFDAMKNAQNYVAISKSASKLGEFVSLIEELREVAAKEPVSVLIERTLILSGYRDMLIAAGEAEEDRLRNVEELISSAVEYEEAAEEPTLSGFLEEISLVSDIDNYDKDTDAVVLMTIHSAKGLEFPIVFLPGFEEGLFPGMQSALHPEELEEERRLAYVALTRAKDKLYITNVRDRLLYGKTMFNEPSRFFTEIPKEYIETEEIRRRAAERVPAESESFQTKRTRTMSSEFLRDSDLSSNVGKTTGYERFTAGDRVSHLTFGQGTVLSCKEYGADLLYEIAFDDVGTKKLMATYAKLKPVK